MEIDKPLLKSLLIMAFREIRKMVKLSIAAPAIVNWNYIAQATLLTPRWLV